jgi:transcription antitermination factor NusG
MMLMGNELKPIAPFVKGQIVGYVDPAMKGAERWLLGHCIGKSDAHVEAVLKRAQIDEYYPQIREFRPVPRKTLSQKQRASGVVVKRPILVPLLPRYRLLRVDVRRNDLDDIFALAGIGGMVCEGGVVITVPQSFIDQVRKTESEGAIPGSTSARVIFSQGEQVRIAGGGPFAQFNAVVERGMDIPIEELDPDTRIKVAISLLGRLSSLELSISDIEKL